jgi:hypothetical protein
MRRAFVVLVVSIGALSALELAAPSSPARPSTAECCDCDEIIGQAETPRDGGYRPVLARVSVPPAYRPQVVPSGEQAWPYWSKAGLVVKASRTPVIVSVSKAWRNRAAISWGNSSQAIVGTLRVAGCPWPRNGWNAFAGGFYLRVRSACVPLVFRVGNWSATVRFGLGRRCSAISRVSAR